VISFFFLSLNFVVAQSKHDSDLNNELIVRLKTGSLYKISFENDIELDTIISSYLNDPNVDYVEPNYQYNITAFPNDEYYNNQIYLRKINAKSAWSKELLEKQLHGINNKVVIAVIDTGVDTDHPDLKNQMWQNNKEIAGNNRDDDSNGYVDDIFGWDFVNKIPDPNPKFGLRYTKDGINHGTLVAGIAAAAGNNNEGVAGISWDAEIMALRALDSVGRGNLYDVSLAVAYARENGADIINMSFVGLDYSQALYDEIKKAYDDGIVIVAAAGNTDSSIQGINLDETKSYPVCYDGENGENMVIGVASVDDQDLKAGFSNYGNSCIDISAPGENFFGLSVYNPKEYGYSNFYDGNWSGTSVSAPLVAGTMAILKSLNANLINTDLEKLVLDNADNINTLNLEYIGKLGLGRLNIYRAVNALSSYASSGNDGDPKKADQDVRIVAGLGFGSVPQVKIFNLQNEYLRGFYPYAVNFNGAVNVATGDVDGDGKSEIITSMGEGGVSQIKVFDEFGNLENNFFAYNRYFKGGVNIAVGDINKDNVDEIITGAGPGGGPHVRVFDNKGNLKSEFFAYVPGFVGGVNVAVGDVDGDKKNEIITGAGPGGGPHVRVFDQYGNIKRQFFAYQNNFTGGVKVASGDVDGVGINEVITVTASQGSPHVKIFTFSGNLLYDFYAFHDFNNGLNITSADINGDDTEEIIVAKNKGGNSEVIFFNQRGVKNKQMILHSATYLGGVRPAILK